MRSGTISVIALKIIFNTLTCLTQIVNKKIIDSTDKSRYMAAFKDIQDLDVGINLRPEDFLGG